MSRAAVTAAHRGRRGGSMTPPRVLASLREQQERLRQWNPQHELRAVHRAEFAPRTEIDQLLVAAFALEPDAGQDVGRVLVVIGPVHFERDEEDPPVGAPLTAILA